MSDPKTCKECGCELEDGEGPYCDDCLFEDDGDDEFEDDEEASEQ